MNEIWQDLLHARAEATLPIGFVLAVGVTIHILLHKRQVASAVGWIGLVWFAPIGGAICYLLLGVNRVRRRAHLLRARNGDGDDPSAQPLPGADTLNALGRGIGRITARSLLAGTATHAFQNGDNAYPPMLAAIAAARHSI